LQKTNLMLVENNNVKKILPFRFFKGNWEQSSKKEKPFKYQVSAQTLLVQDAQLSWSRLTADISKSTATPNVSIINDFFIPELRRNRRIWVYLPLDYKKTDKCYPVIYMHDGQNLFDRMTSYSGEWQVDETMNLLQAQGDFGAIVVGIDNGGINRLNEYSPWRNSNYGGGEGDLYLDFIVKTLKPYIDTNYRTLPERATTGMIGSSMGGLITMYAGLKYPDIFSKLGVFSPSFWFGSNIFKLAREKLKMFDTKVYLMGGEKESATMVSSLRRMYDTLQAVGYTKEELHLAIRPDAMHSEWFWQREYPIAYKWLFEDVACEEYDDMVKHETGIFRNAQSELLAMETEEDDKTVTIYNANWEQVLCLKPDEEGNMDLEGLPDDLYFLQYQYQQRTIFRKAIVKSEIMAT
jgi:predicted alpha/beta superfamily hydrolase